MRGFPLSRLRRESNEWLREFSYSENFTFRHLGENQAISSFGIFFYFFRLSLCYLKTKDGNLQWLRNENYNCISEFCRILHWRILSARLNVPFYHGFFPRFFLPLFDKEYECKEFRKCCISLIITHSGNPMHSIECILILGYSVDNFYYSKKSLFE